MQVIRAVNIQSENHVAQQKKKCLYPEMAGCHTTECVQARYRTATPGQISWICGWGFCCRELDIATSTISKKEKKPIAEENAGKAVGLEGDVYSFGIYDGLSNHGPRDTISRRLTAKMGVSFTSKMVQNGKRCFITSRRWQILIL